MAPTCPTPTIATFIAKTLSLAPEVPGKLRQNPPDGRLLFARQMSIFEASDVLLELLDTTGADQHGGDSPG